MKNYRVAIRRETEDNAKRRQTRFEGIEEVVIDVDSGEFVSDDCPVTWSVAEENTVTEVCTFWLNDFLGYDKPTGVLVATNKDGYFGASVVLFEDVINRAKEKLRADKLIMIPSSVHEVLLMAYDEKNFEGISSLVSVVNESEVAPNEQLGDHAFII